MSESDRDEMIGRVAAALRPLPEVRDEARARVLVAVAAERQAERERALRRRRLGRKSGYLIAGLAASALVVVWLKGGRHDAAPAPTVAVAHSSAVPPAALAANDAAAGLAPVVVQLMVNAPEAHRVRLVGDFTGWDARGIEMQRDSASGLWSATAPVRPGRHVYAFIVDDSTWMRDPRAPIAPDSDFGKPGSLLIVGRP